MNTDHRDPLFKIVQRRSAWYVFSVVKANPIAGPFMGITDATMWLSDNYPANEARRYEVMQRTLYGDKVVEATPSRCKERT